ncbi:MAG: ABC transporter ATP-binding protein [Lachnospiraceae bacterium]
MKLEVRQVTKTFGIKTALDNVSISLENGITGLLGPNGAGKSTLMRILATIDIPQQGAVLLDGHDIGKDPKVMRRVLGYLPQDFGVYPNMNAVEFLEYMAAMSSLSMGSAKKRINELLDSLHLSDVKNKPLGGYSGGMRQRVGIAQALLNDPSILIVDEPTVGLDPVERIQFRNLLASLSADRIIILSTHIVTDVESIAPKIALMKGGRILEHSTPEDMISSVEGQVWQCVVGTAALPDFQKKFVVTSSMQRSDGIYVRVLSNQKPLLDAQLIQPSLEDAYLYYTLVKEGGMS